MIEREDVGDVAVLRLANGPVNVMNLDLFNAVIETFAGLAEDPAKAIVITGGGGRAFSAGVDLNAFLDGGESYAKAFLPALSEALMAVFSFDRPVVAAVNGHAIAGGAVLAFCADHRIMSTGKGRIGTPEVLVGVPFPRVPLDLVVYAVGEQVARKLVIGGQTYDPDAALALGMVDELAEPDGLLGKAVDTAAHLATSVPADTFAHTKLQLRRHTIERIVNYEIDEDPKAQELWLKRIEDGWMAGYLNAATGKK
jgi:enoyl-CoA hydratase